MTIIQKKLITYLINQTHVNIPIPISIETIGDSAFYGCSSLQTINFENSIQTVESSSFQQCSSLKTINFGNSIHTIGNSAFQDCPKLNEIIFYKKEKTPNIGTSAFDGLQEELQVYVPKNYKGTTFGVFSVNKTLPFFKIHHTIIKRQHQKSFYFMYY